jgi:hypothetical protein
MTEIERGKKSRRKARIEEKEETHGDCKAGSPPAISQQYVLRVAGAEHEKIS